MQHPIKSGLLCSARLIPAVGISLALLTSSAVYASSANIDTSKIDSQATFSDLVKDLGAAINYKSVSPAEPLGITGFDIGFEISATSVENKATLNNVFGGDVPSTLYVPKLHAHKGLPFGLDVGAFYSKVPSSNIKLLGGELKYAILEGSTVTPALALRGTYSKLSGVDNLTLNTTGIELAISKGFAMFTPYAGVGAVRYSGDASVSTLPNLSSEHINKTKVFLGLNFNLGLVNIAAETEKLGDNSTTSAKIGLRF